MSDRLAELRRQRALLQQHLEWLDREIGRAEGRIPGALPIEPPPAEAAANDFTATVPPTSADADALLAHYAGAPAQSQAEVKRGCWAAFALALAGLGLGCAVWYFLRAQ